MALLAVATVILSLALQDSLRERDLLAAALDKVMADLQLFNKKANKRAQAVDPEIVDLGARVSEWAKNWPGRSDISETYYESDAATIHMHALGFEQTTPLHIHRSSEEAVIIVSGTARVTRVYRENSRPELDNQDYEEGALIHSPPLHAHEWMNQSKDRFQGNLVFTAPPFDGNFYVKPLDPRILSEAASSSFTYQPKQQLADFAASKRSYQISPLPIMGGKLALLFVNGEYLWQRQPRPVILYTTAGSGTFTAATKRPIAVHSLVIIPAGLMGKIEALPNAALALYILNPQG